MARELLIPTIEEGVWEEGHVEEETTVDVEGQGPFGIVKSGACPKPLLSVMEGMSDDQKKAVADMGFGNLLRLKIDEIPLALAFHVVSSLDTKAMVIRTATGEIPVNRRAVHEVYGFPMGKMPIVSVFPQFRYHSDEMTRRWKNHLDLDLRTPVRPSHLVEKIRATRAADFMFKVDFLVLMVSALIIRMRNGSVNQRIIPSIMTASVVKDLDWCGLVVEAIKSCKYEWFRNYNSSCFLGPITFLVLLYCDRVHFVSPYSPKIKRTRPVIVKWKKYYLKNRQDNELECGGFGFGEILPEWSATAAGQAYLDTMLADHPDRDVHFDGCGCTQQVGDDSGEGAGENKRAKEKEKIVEITADKLKTVPVYVVEGGQNKEVGLTTRLATNLLEANQRPVTEPLGIQNASLSKDKRANENLGQDLDVRLGHGTKKYSAKKRKQDTKSPAQDSQDTSKESWKTMANQLDLIKKELITIANATDVESMANQLDLIKKWLIVLTKTADEGLAMIDAQAQELAEFQKIAAALESVRPATQEPSFILSAPRDDATKTGEMMTNEELTSIRIVAALPNISDTARTPEAKRAPITVHDPEGTAEQSSEVSESLETCDTDPDNLPFVKSSSLWKSIESKKAFRMLPQKPHFRPLLEGVNKSAREGLAIGTMVTFSTVFDKTFGLKSDEPRSTIEDLLKTLLDLENNGFEVEVIRERLTGLLMIKDKQEKIEEHNVRIKRDEEEIEEIDRLIREQEEKRKQVVLKKEKWDSEISVVEAMDEEIEQELRRVNAEFDRLAAAP